MCGAAIMGHEPEITVVHEWLDNWSGLGLIAMGMERQGYRLHLTNVAPGTWRATFSSHPMMSAERFGAGTSVNLPMQKTVGEAAREAGVAASARPRRLGARCRKPRGAPLKTRTRPALLRPYGARSPYPTTLRRALPPAIGLHYCGRPSRVASRELKATVRRVSNESQSRASRTTVISRGDVRRPHEQERRPRSTRKDMQHLGKAIHTKCPAALTNEDRYDASFQCHRYLWRGART